MSDHGSTGSSRLTRRTRLVLAVAVAAVLVSAGGLLGAQFVRSPAQVAADTAEPPAAVLTAAVERRRLTRQQVMRGQVYPPVRYDIVPVAASSEIAALFLSKATPAVGVSIGSGQFLGEVSGRPLFALKGAVPAYRDLAIGATGPDVTQLQQALRDLGYGRGADQVGVLGAGTAKAIAAFYRARGYPPPGEAGGGQQPRQPSPDRSASSAATAPAAGGTVLPRGEAVFLPELPATVLGSSGVVGRPVSGALLQLVTSGLVATGQLNPAAQGQIKAGMRATIVDDTSRQTISGTVTSVGEPSTEPPAGVVVTIGSSGGSGQSAAGGPATGPGGPGKTAAYLPVSVTPEQPLPPGWSGRSVRLTVDTAASAGEVLAVPLSAIVTTASGSTTVTRVEPGGAETAVPVSTGLSADGLVEVRPAGAAKLAAGDRVRVGR